MCRYNLMFSSAINDKDNQKVATRPPDYFLTFRLSNIGRAAVYLHILVYAVNRLLLNY